MQHLSAIEGRLKRLLRDTPLKTPVKALKERLDLAHHALTAQDDRLIRPTANSIYLSLTANCNLRCATCHYGRDFMPGHQLPWSIGEPLLEDAKALGYQSVRLYGGEPLLHRDLRKYVQKIADLQMSMWMTTNGLLLDKKIDPLIEAGLNRLSVGFYGIGAAYETYVGRKGAFDVVCQGIAATRKRHRVADLRMHLDWLLMRPTSRPESVEATLRFAREHEMQIFVNLIHYSLPYFLSGSETGNYAFTEADRGLLTEVVDVLLAAKEQDPTFIRNSERGLRSIPDWLILKSEMKVPCTEYDMVWVGPDGTVQMCYVTFKLGNLHDGRLRDMVMTEQHARHARDAFALNCPNCHCSFDKRVLRHLASRRRYGG